MRAVVLLTVATMGCFASTLPPVVAPPVLDRIATVSVFDEHGDVVVGAHGTLILDVDPETPIEAGGDGRLVFALDASHPPCGEAWLTVSAPGYLRWIDRVMVPTANDDFLWGDGCPSGHGPWQMPRAAIKLTRDVPRLVV